MESRKNITNDKHPIDPGIKEKVQLFVTGELDEKEHKQVFDWISSSPGNRRYYNGFRAVLRAAE